MANKIKRAQVYIEGLTVAEMIIEFRKEFNDVYDKQTLNSDPFMAVGPCHSFIGFCIQRGYIETT